MKRYFYLLLMGISLSWSSEIDEIQKEFNAYRDQQIREFQTFVQTLDGIPNLINPYQKESILPLLEKTKTKEKTLSLPVLYKPTNTVQGASGSQLALLNAPKPTSFVSLEMPYIPKNREIRNDLMIDFFGNRIALAKELYENHDQTQDFIRRLQAIREENELNDWDMVLLIQNIVNTIYQKNENEHKTKYAVRLLGELGYDIRLAKSRDNIFYMLIASEDRIYAKNYCDYEGKKYYIFDIEGHPRKTIDVPLSFVKMPYDGKGKPLNMRMKNDPNIGIVNQKVMLQWDYHSKRYQLEVEVNKNLVALQDMYPQVEPKIYLESYSGRSSLIQLSQKLQEIMKKEKMPLSEQTEFILHFVQKAFVYKTDFEAYGYERPFFITQTLLLPYSDCEDRAILLSHLYREVLGLKSIGLLYPGHMSLGILSPKQESDGYYVNNQFFVVADGTYFYAPVGVSQPEFKGKKAQIILIASEKE